MCDRQTCALTRKAFTRFALLHDGTCSDTEDEPFFEAKYCTIQRHGWGTKAAKREYDTEIGSTGFPRSGAGCLGHTYASALEHNAEEVPQVLGHAFADALIEHKTQVACSAVVTIASRGNG